MSETTQKTEAAPEPAPQETQPAAQPEVKPEPPAPILKEEAKKDEEKKPETPKAQEKLELKGNDGAPLDESMLLEVRPIAKELGLDSAKAQKVVDLHAKLQQAQYEKTMRDWEAATKADSEIGGKSLNDSISHAKRALRKFGSPELMQWLGATPAGSHPEVIRMLSRIGKAIAEDSVAGSTGNNAATAANPEEVFLRKLYPTMFRKT